MAKLPHVLTDINVFLKDESFAGIANKLTLPEIVLKTAEKMTSGTAGAIERSLGRMEKLEAEITIEAFSPVIASLVGTNRGRDEMIIVRGALDVDGGHIPLTVRMSGLWKTAAYGEMTPEKEIEVSSKIAVEHFEIELNGVEMVYIDKLTNVWRMGGIDINQEIRACLGQ